MIEIRRQRRPARNFLDVQQQLDDVWAALDIISQSLPTGTIAAIPAGNDKIPPGWLPCDGSAIYGVAQYPILAKLVGSRFGGDGVTSFGVPDLRNTVLQGFDRDRSGSARVATFLDLTVDVNADGSTATVPRFFVNWMIKT